MNSLKPLALLSGYLGRAGTQLVILWAFARTSGPEGAGQFAFALAVSSPVVVIFELALRNVYQTLADAPPFRTFLSLRILCTGLACAALATAGHFVPGFPPFAVLGPLLVMKFADSVLDIGYARLQVKERIWAVSGWLWANNSLTLVCIAVTLLAGGSAEFALAASATASVAIALILIPRLVAGSGAAEWKPQRAHLSRITKAGIALGAAQALASALVYLPVFYLARWGTTEAIGIFAVCQYAMTLATTFFNAVLQTRLTPMRRALAAQGRAGLNRQARSAGVYMGAVGVLGGGMTLLALVPVLPWAFGQEFRVSHMTVLPIALAVFLLGVEYIAAGPLLVLNRYGARIVGSAVGLALGIAAAGMAGDQATVADAGYVMLAGVIGQCITAFAAWRGVYGLRGSTERAVA